MEYIKTHRILDQARREIRRIYSEKDLYTTKGCGSAVIRMGDVSVRAHRSDYSTSIFTHVDHYRVFYSNIIKHTEGRPKTLDHLPEICARRIVKELIQAYE